MAVEKDFLPFIFVGGEPVIFSVEGVKDFLEKEDAVKLMLSNLSNISRYNGATGKPWTVLMHSVLCARLARHFEPGASEDFFRAVLCHDLAEAFVGDIIRPVKSLCGNALQDFEGAIEELVNEKFDIKYNAKLSSVKYFDDLAASCEMDYFFGWSLFSKNYSSFDLIEHIKELQSCDKVALIGFFLKEFDRV